MEKNNNTYLRNKQFISFIVFFLSILSTSVYAQSKYFTKLASPIQKNYSSGCAWIDYNNDNKLDLYLSHFNVNCQLYSLNGNNEFQLVTNSNLIPNGNNFSALSWGDYDNDGYPDLYVTSMNGVNVLYQNNGNGTFQNISNNTVLNDRGNFLYSIWIDYDNDGFLDLFIPTVADLSFTKRNGSKNLLYKNNGDGTFRKITDNAIVAETGNEACAVFTDFDNDGDQDLFMTERGKDNWFFENNGDGTFIKVTGATINTNDKISITASWADYDNDGFMDLFVGNGSTQATHKQTNYLFKNNGDKTFTPITETSITDYNGCVWTSAWGDVNNDGWIDLYLGTIYEKEELLYINNGDGTFTLEHEFEINNSNGGTGITGASFGDFDNDGFIDLLVADANANPTIVFHNKGNNNNWINITCKGTVSNKSAIGARVKVKATIFGKTFWQIRDVQGNQGFRGSHDLRVHFGLGDATKIDSLIVLWPSKETTIVTDVSVNQFLTITEDIPVGYLRPSFKVGKTTGYSPLEVQFTDISVCDEKNPIISWSWDFDGDGIEDSNEKNPLHIFNTYEENNYTIQLTVSNSSKIETVVRENYIHVIPQHLENIALGKLVSASSVRVPFNSSNVIDGKTTSLWKSMPSDTQWIQIKLEEEFTIGKIILRWGSDFAVEYKIKYSIDEKNWYDLLNIDNGSGSVEEFIVKEFNAKYVKFYFNKSSANKGYGIYEIEFYRPSPVNSISTGSEILPTEFLLYQNYPNPFNPTTNLQFYIGFKQHVNLKIYDILGNEVAVLINEEKSAGLHNVVFNAQKLSSGVYFYQLATSVTETGNSIIQTKKMLLIK